MQEEKKYKAIVAYDGTDFYGWQIQPDKRTIVGTLQDSFYSVFRVQIRIVGASRTDAGVHAAGQIFSFSSSFVIPVEKMLLAWNAALPASINIRSLCIAHHAFHPQKSVLYKEYRYYLFYRKPTPCKVRYGLYCENLSIDLLHKALQRMIGEHDFRPLSVVMPDSIKTIRTVQSIRIIKNPLMGAYCIIIRGHGFLRYMIRRMIGAALECARGRCTLDYISSVLRDCIIHNQLPVAPPHGLFLTRIVYRS